LLADRKKPGNRIRNRRLEIITEALASPCPVSEAETT